MKKTLLISLLSLVWASHTENVVINNATAATQTKAVVRAGVLDTTFSVDGKVNESNMAGFPEALAVQPDGKIVVVGAVGGYFGLVRYDTNGTLDTSFNSVGYMTATVVGTPKGVAIQPDGKIVVAGESGTNLVIARYNSDGSLDTSFNSVGYLTGNPGTLNSDIKGVALQSNGKIVVGGQATGNTYFVARYTADGTLDITFGGGDGYQTLNEGTNIKHMVLQSDDKILLVGYSATVRVARFTADGMADTTFDGNGEAQVNAGPDAGMYAIGVQSNGRIITVGDLDSGGWTFAIVGIKTDGSLDTNFGGTAAGYTLLTNIRRAHGITIQSDNKIVVTGHDNVTNNEIIVARFNVDGTLDTNFGSGGYILIDTNSSANDQARAVGMTPDGKIVVSGQNTGNFETIRLTNNIDPLTQASSLGGGGFF